MNKCVVVYGGMRYAPPDAVYMTLSAIMYERKSEAGMNSVVNDCSLSVVCELPCKSSSLWIKKR